MLGYLKKFNNLPAELKHKVSSKEVMAVIEALEKKYHLALAALIMKIMVKEVALDDLIGCLLKEKLTEIDARQLTGELREKVFFSLGGYLSAKASPPAAAPERLLKKLPAMEVGPVDEPTVKGASFFFSPDDEAEIRELAKKIEAVERPVREENTELPGRTIEEKLADIINRVQINFGSAELALRFAQILKTYLRGIRNRLETKQTLIKPFLNGGLSFDENSAQQVMTIADKVLRAKTNSSAEIDQPVLPPKIKMPGLDRPAESPAATRDMPYDFSKLKKPEDKIKDDLRVLDTSHELAPAATPASAKAKFSAPLAQANQPPSTEVRPKAQAKEADLSAKETDLSAPPAGDTSQMPLIRRRFEAENLSPSQKVKVEDVKYIPKVMGPLDELKYLSLINFRRLDKNPAVATDKIKSKIELLAEEGYGKRLEGIRLWRSNPVNRLYLAIGHLSISANKPVDVIIEERKMKNLDYLTSEEFKAIMDLNKSLRF